jgi:hypothetical protein
MSKEIEQLKEEIANLKAQLAAKQAITYVAKPTACDLDDYTEGEFKDSKGEVFLLKTGDADAYGHTHFLKNNDHFWAGSKEAFRALFEKA